MEKSQPAGSVLSGNQQGMPISRVIPAGLSDPSPFGYVPATVAPADAELVHISGQVGLAPSGPNDFATQLDRAFANLGTVLAALELEPTNVARSALLGVALPASTLIPVPSLALPEMLFEIDAVAIRETKP